MKVFSYKELKRNKDIAIFFGCGPSINDIGKNDYRTLKKFDKWSLNFFLYHDFIIPDFYFRSCRKRDTNFKHFKDIWNKKKQYKQTKFLSDGSIDRIEELDVKEVYLIDFYRGHKNIPDYRKQLEDFKILDNSIYFYGRSSLCALLVLMYEMGYKEIVLYGNDLITKNYFWTNNKEKRVHWRWVKEGKRGTSRRGNHPNIKSLKEFIPFFNEKYMNNGIYVGSKKTPLYPEIPYKPIEDLK